MTASNWPDCIKFTLKFEGGYDANPKDRGNWSSGVIGQGELKGTKYGIAAHVYPQLDIKNLTLENAKAIYRKDYWPKVAGDDQPAGVDLVTWDICVNSGASRALKFLRAVIGSDAPSAKGVANDARRFGDNVGIVKTLCAKRAAFYRSLSTFDTFGRGWLRRNAEAEALGVAMALRDMPLKPATVEKHLKTEKEKADVATAGSTGGAATAGAGGTATTQTDTAWGFDWWTALEIGAIAAAVVVAIFFVRKAIQNNERAKAYAAAIKELAK